MGKIWSIARLKTNDNGAGLIKNVKRGYRGGIELLYSMNVHSGKKLLTPCLTVDFRLKGIESKFCFKYYANLSELINLYFP